MLLFLDVISPLSEFSLIEDNKLVQNIKITENTNDKLSDCIFKKFEEIENKMNLLKYLKKIIITIGPGSYTNLRVGASFVSAINISKNIPICQLSAHDIIKFKCIENNNNKIGFYICSANDQKFFCSFDKFNKLNFKKIVDSSNLEVKEFQKIYFNYEELKFDNKKIDQEKIIFVEEVISNLDKLNFIKDLIIKPIFISNNKILN